MRRKSDCAKALNESVKLEQKERERKRIASELSGQVGAKTLKSWTKN